MNTEEMVVIEAKHPAHQEFSWWSTKFTKTLQHSAAPTVFCPMESHMTSAPVEFIPLLYLFLSFSTVCVCVCVFVFVCFKSTKSLQE